jgi:hypothetical protein
VRAALLGAWLSATKVVLFTVGSASYLAGRPAADLAWVYLGLAVLAAGTAVAMAPALERLPPVRSLARLLAASMAATAALALGLATAVPGSSWVLLILAHLYNIASEITFWLVAAAWLPPPELRRATVWICLAAALGGCAGGLAVERLLVLGLAAALAIGTLGATLGALSALVTGGRALQAGGAELAATKDETTTTVPEVSWGEILAHPLGPPLGAAAFLLTLVWSLTEFLCLARYQELYVADLGPQLARIFAVLQLVEFACILLLSGPATRWVPPAWRSALFPVGALLTLQLFGAYAAAPSRHRSGPSCLPMPIPRPPPTRCSIRCTPATSPRCRLGCRRGCARSPTASVIRWAWRRALFCCCSPRPGRMRSSLRYCSRPRACCFSSASACSPAP